MLTAILMAALAQPLIPPPNPPGAPLRPRQRGFIPRSGERISRSGADTYAFFEFAPSSGAGMGAACACAAVTGAKGESMTFTRASSATCTKGNPTTGIANGDLVTCTTNQPRVGAPTGGSLMLLVEGARTNSVLRSQELGTASWALFATGVANPTVTADFAVSPDGTSTAERIQVPATSAAQLSIVYQTVATAAASVFSVYIKGNGASGTTDVCAQSGTYICAACAFVASSWTRCSVSIGAAGSQVVIGNASSLNGGTARSAVDVLAWGAQFEVGTYVTSYIPTTSAAVTRATEASPTFTVATLGPSFSLAASAWWGSSSIGAVDVVSLGTAAPDLAKIGRSTNTAAAFTINATSTTPAVSAIDTTLQRGALADSAGTRSAFWQSASVSAPAASITGTVTTATLGVLDGYVGAVCVDPSPARCR